MRKQTKLVAVLSASALLALGASMTSFAATGWQEENGTWVYYNKSGDQVTATWEKSGDNWFYLNSDGELSTETLVEDDNDNYYYVDANGAMVKNAWVAIENEDAGDDNEPDQWWYYFGANGKAYKGSDSSTTVSLKTINGKKYAFNSDAQMLYGWIDADDATIINDDEDAWQRGDYYFGDSDDGAMTVGWLLLDITDNDASSDDTISPVFNDDEDQSRWFCFKSNGKKWASSSDDTLKEKTINGAKYGFDQYGRMVAEWSLASTGSAATSSDWKYFSDVESGARVTKGWFKVVPAEALDQSKYDDDDAGWYYADNSGNIYASEIKTIKSKKYAFNAKGRMLSGMRFMLVDGNTIEDQLADDDDDFPFDTEDNFNENAPLLAAAGYKCYYFGDSSDGAMKTGTMSVEIDGDKFSFNFGKSGSKKGVGLTGKDSKKYYSSGMLMKAGKDEKYQVVVPVLDDEDAASPEIVGYNKLEDNNKVEAKAADTTGVVVYDTVKAAATATGLTEANIISYTGLSSTKYSNGEYGDLAIYVTNGTLGLSADDFIVVNTSGKVTTGSSKVKDGNDVYYKLYSNKLVATYAEN